MYVKIENFLQLILCHRPVFLNLRLNFFKANRFFQKCLLSLFYTKRIYNLLLREFDTELLPILFNIKFQLYFWNVLASIRG